MTLRNYVVLVVVLMLSFGSVVPVDAEAQGRVPTRLRGIYERTVETARRRQNDGCRDVILSASLQQIDNVVNAIRIGVEGVNSTPAVGFRGHAELTITGRRLYVVSSHTVDGVNYVDLAGDAAERFLDGGGRGDTWDDIARDAEDLWLGPPTEWFDMMTDDTSSQAALHLGVLALNIRSFALYVRSHEMCGGSFDGGGSFSGVGGVGGVGDPDVEDGVGGVGGVGDPDVEDAIEDLLRDPTVDPTVAAVVAGAVGAAFIPGGAWGTIGKVAEVAGGVLLVAGGEAQRRIVDDRFLFASPYETLGQSPSTYTLGGVLLAMDGLRRFGMLVPYMGSGSLIAGGALLAFGPGSKQCLSTAGNPYLRSRRSEYEEYRRSIELYYSNGGCYASYDWRNFDRSWDERWTGRLAVTAERVSGRFWPGIAMMAGGALLAIFGGDDGDVDVSMSQDGVRLSRSFGW